ncbi:trehalose-phosphatase [Stappia sp. F7233]|uniref:Trehalose 6-phosphate phosphatase n=1 Tax=Stappia albiluteola TaxID=2758565 RepID=A0A839AF47_9HYPH|nr:trehalose-phosphatase [Stappia albiluteola]MBA5777417.1 trehalose-phosphatase [Stappia albiluteola]
MHPNKIPEPPPLARDIALFLDFDGTLVEIAERPQDVRLAPGLAGLLSRRHDDLDGALAVVSGRRLGEIDAFLSPLRLAGSGMHGLEFRKAAGAPAILREADPEVAELRERLKRADPHARGLVIEDKGAGLVLHYRHRPELAGLARDLMAGLLEDLPGLHLLEGKMIVEVKPKHTSKGTSVEMLLSLPPFAGRQPVFIGDDVTDEDGMAAADRLGGFGIKVGEGESVARYRLADVAAVHSWLAGKGAHDKD